MPLSLIKIVKFYFIVSSLGISQRQYPTWRQCSPTDTTSSLSPDKDGFLFLHWWFLHHQWTSVTGWLLKPPSCPGGW